MSLSPEEKREMLEDGLSIKRRDDFRVAKKFQSPMSFMEYLQFLDELQTLFGPFKVSQKPTQTKYNRL